MSARFAGRICIVTGAGSGIGWAVAERLAAEGAHIIAVDLIEDRVQAVVAAIRAGGGSADPCTVDVADASAPARIVERAATAGGLDVLCNVAGIGLWKPMATTTRDEWQRVADGHDDAR